MSKPQIAWTFPLFLGFWLILNVLQATFTSLDPDEAYYWVYAQNLDWGYFDHPPAVALMIKIGTLLLPGTLGLRFLVVLANALTLLVIWDLADRPQRGRSVYVLLALMVAMPFLHLYGFITTPDAPLMLFTALFFWAYRRFLAQPNLASALCWAFIMAALLYSKYHGILLIFFTVLSNLRLFRNPWFYLAGFLGALLFLPHLYWQYSHDFPSFRYHLKGRDDVYELKYTTTYLLNQLVIFSPLLVPSIALAFFRLRFETPILRAYRLVVLGFWAFFLWSTTKGHVEPQWTAILSIPLVLIFFAYAQMQDVFSKTVIGLGLATAGLLLLTRLALVYMIGPLGKDFDNQGWIDQVQQKAGTTPVLFHNTYRSPALYAFYTGQKAYELTTSQYRKSQYDLWNDEVDLQDKKVYLVMHGDTYCTQCDSLNFGRNKMLGLELKDFQVVEKITLEVLDTPKSAVAGDSISVRVKLHNPYPFSIDPQRGTYPVKPGVAFHRQGQVLWVEDCTSNQPLGIWKSGKDYILELKCRTPLEFKGKLDLVFGLRYANLQPTLAGEAVELLIK